MKNALLKTMTASAFALTVIYTNAAFAYTKSGYLGTGATATDLYEVKCSTNTAGATYRLVTQVRTGAAAAAVKVSVATQKLPKATNTTDTVNGDSAFSPAAFNIGGNGIYYVTVGKTVTTSAAVPYVLLFDCQTRAGARTGATLTQTQNQ